MSAISVRCPGCRRRLAAPTEAAGRTLKCPNCQASVTVVLDGNTVVDDEAPDFSYLKETTESDEDILMADGADDGESALGQSTARRPAKPTIAAKVATPTTPPVIYTPPPATDNPFAALAGRSTPQRRKPDPPYETAEPPSKARRDSLDPESVVRTPRWVWPALVTLMLYSAVATGMAAWGWLRPNMPDATTGKLTR